MADPLTPTAAHEALDANGWLDAAHGPGCYSLRLTTPPDDPRAVFEHWTAHHDAAPQWIIDGLADADRLAYVGASGDVYGRIQDHAEAEVRRAAILRVYPPVEVLGVEPRENPFEAEFNETRRWVENQFVVWSDGVLHGL